MRPLRDDDPPGTRVVVIDSEGRPRREVMATLVRLWADGCPAVVRLDTDDGAARSEWADDCRVLEEGDEP